MRLIRGSGSTPRHAGRRRARVGAARRRTGAPALPVGDEGARVDPRHRRGSSRVARGLDSCRGRTRSSRGYRPINPQKVRPWRSSWNGPRTARSNTPWPSPGSKRRRAARPCRSTGSSAAADLFVDPETKKQIYAADGGDLITVANFSGAILDLPTTSSSNDAERSSYVADATKIPPRGTPVTMIFRSAKAKAMPPKAAAKP